MTRYYAAAAFAFAACYAATLHAAYVSATLLMPLPPCQDAYFRCHYLSPAAATSAALPALSAMIRHAAADITYSC